MLSQHAITNKLFQHASSQSEARAARHTIPACSGSQSQIWKARQTIPAYATQASQLSQHTLQGLTCTKEAAKAQNSRQTDTVK